MIVKYIVPEVRTMYHYPRLRDLREDKGNTQTEIAALLGIDQRVYSNYETGKVQLDYEKIIYLCKRLEITPNDLFGFP